MNPKPLLLIIFSLFVFHFSLFAKEALPPLVKDGGLFSYRVPIMRETVLKTNEKGRRALLGELVGKI